MNSNSKKAIIVTGVSGGIGAAIATDLSSLGYKIIGIDIEQGEKLSDYFIEYDLEKCLNESDLLYKVSDALKHLECSLNGLINNAAIQILGGISELSKEEWKKSLDVNLSVPFILVKMFLEDLQKNRGVVVNISSIHQDLTKKGFIAYSTSKAALTALTKAMAVELSSKIKINCICPAAIETPMLLDGFKNNLEALKLLKKAHPTGTIGNPSDVSNLVSYLVNDATNFLNGSCINVDGAISARLHDPV